MDPPAFRVLVAESVKIQAEKRSIQKRSVEKPKMDTTKMCQTGQPLVTGQRRETYFRLRKSNGRDASVPQLIYPTIKRQTRRRTVPLRFWMSWISTVIIGVVKKEEAGAILATDTISRQLSRCICKIILGSTLMFCYRSTRGTRRPLIIALIVPYSNLRGVMMTWRRVFRRCARKLPLR